MTDVERRLSTYLFPVTESAVYRAGAGEDGVPQLSKDYKAIVRQDNGQLISIQRKTYKLVPNSEVIKPLMEQLHKLDTSWHVDSSHSFVDDSKMRLSIVFPELVINDGRSDIALSLYLHNSYDSSEGVRMYFGAIRAICKNGMVFGQILSKFYGKHTVNFDMEHLQRELTATADKLPVIKHRIGTLLESKVDKNLRMEIDRRLGKRVTKYIESQEQETQRAANQWAMYNIITYYVSHLVRKQLRSDYQIRTSKIFGL
ncbi:MAG: DUF932 domain-containing protein [Bacteroidetes bacterium]|nr:DUF932 domain-containing protein [Bacteroidota bacterium]